MGTRILGATYEATPADEDAISGGPTLIRAVKENMREQLRGYLQISITNLGTDDTNMKIEVGSVFEVNGVLIEIVTADEPTEAFTITDITDETVGYVYVTAAGVFSIAETAPTWDAAKQGWYNGTSRAIAGFTRDGSNYDSKFILTKQEDLFDTDHKKLMDRLTDDLNASNHPTKIANATTFEDAVTRYYSVSLVGNPTLDLGVWAQFVANTTRYYAVNLPHGAVVTNLYSYANIGDGTLTVTLHRVDKTLYTPDTTMASNAHSSGGALNDSSITNATIDNDGYKYFAKIARANHSTTAYIRGIVITYEVTKPLP